MDPDADTDPAIFVIELQDADKNIIKIFFSVYYLLFEGTLTSFFKEKMSIRSHKTVGIKEFLTIFLMIKGSGPLTNGSGYGSRRPKNIRIRQIRISNIASPQGAR
jgi:hypothetical protein